MSGFYKWLSKWADDRDRAVMERKNRQRGTADKPLTKAHFVNTIDSLEGQIGRWFEQTSSMLVKRTHEIVNKSISDGIAVAVELFRQHTDTQQTWMDKTYQLYDTAAEHRHKELLTMLDAMERNNGGRYLSMIEQSMVTHNFAVTAFERISAQINAAIQPKEAYEPSLKWLVDNHEGIITLGAALQALQDNNAPADIALFNAVKSVRTMLNIDTVDAKEALEPLAQEWGVLELAVAA